MDKLVLFDIDKTLIKSSNGHSLAFSEAFKKVYGIETNIDVINHHGMTDQQVIAEVLKKNGLNEREIKLKIEDCMKAMITAFDKFVFNDKIIVLDGVQELLDEFDKKNILMGLVTGNLEPIARGKLKKIGLNHYFKVGGFGSDDINRTNLVKLAIKRANENYNFQLNNNVFLIGDAPQDMKAGKDAGIETIGVTTGIFSKEKLENAGAKFVVENLNDKKIILEIIERTNCI